MSTSQSSPMRGSMSDGTAPESASGDRVGSPAPSGQAVYALFPSTFTRDFVASATRGKALALCENSLTEPRTIYATAETGNAISEDETSWGVRFSQDRNALENIAQTSASEATQVPATSCSLLPLCMVDCDLYAGLKEHLEDAAQQNATPKLTLRLSTDNDTGSVGARANDGKGGRRSILSTVFHAVFSSSSRSQEISSEFRHDKWPEDNIFQLESKETPGGIKVYTMKGFGTFWSATPSIQAELDGETWNFHPQHGWQEAVDYCLVDVSFRT